MPRRRLNTGKALARLAVELGPPLLFFAATRWQNILVGTAVFMAATLLATGVSWYRDNRLPVVPIFGAVLALVLGGITLASGDPAFIAMRPTIGNGVTAIVVAVMLLRGRLVLKSVFGVGVTARDEAWRRLSWWLVAFLALLAGLNEVVLHVWGIEVWVAFKAFGIPALDGIFVAAAWFYLRRHPAPE